MSSEALEALSKFAEDSIVEGGECWARMPVAKKSSVSRVLREMGDGTKVKKAQTRDKAQSRDPENASLKC